MEMIGFRSFHTLLLFIFSAYGLSLKKESVLIPQAFPPDDECDPSLIPVMDKFDMKRFSGAWYELAKSASGYLEVDDATWKIQTTNDSSTFLFTGRDTNGHCIRPIKGKMIALDDPPGTLTLRYQTYSTRVAETVRVLFTDYTSLAIIYLCMNHVHREKQMCHTTGLMGAIWTRRPHVDVIVYENALRYLGMACVHRSILIVRNKRGPCALPVDGIDYGIDDYPAPDYCYQPMDIGFCSAKVQRYYFDPKERRCQTFQFSGCGGNRNNFLSHAECQEKCLSPLKKEPECTSTAKCALFCSPCCSEGRNKCVECNCEHAIEDNSLNCMKRPSFCQLTCAVEEIYPGCYICSCNDENEVFMDSPTCLEAEDTGECEDQIERFYFNVITRECEQFIYTGCKGNSNNFETLEKCLETCQVPDSSTFKSVVKETGDGANSFKYNKWTIVAAVMLFTIFV